jgi:hypothetical protein
MAFAHTNTPQSTAFAFFFAISSRNIPLVAGGRAVEDTVQGTEVALDVACGVIVSDLIVLRCDGDQVGTIHMLIIMSHRTIWNVRYLLRLGSHGNRSQDQAVLVQVAPFIFQGFAEGRECVCTTPHLRHPREVADHGDRARHR